ncbi:MAG: shikimate dehydrogenase, partial [Comamonadaceae bacterium]
MDLYCVMGNPIEHSRSPWIHSRFAELTGQTLRYERRLVPLGAFAETLMALQDDAAGTLRGCNVTVPFKFDSAAACQHVTPRAALAQAVNVLSLRDDGLHGDNSDGIGLVHDITANAGLDEGAEHTGRTAARADQKNIAPVQVDAGVGRDVVHQPDAVAVVAMQAVVAQAEHVHR